MAIWYVRLTGNDGNAGNFAAPFRTVAHAFLIAAAGDTIDVGFGTFAEANTIVWNQDNLELRGKGPGNTTISGGNALGVISGFSGAVHMGVMHDLELTASAPNIDLLAVPTLAASADLVIGRCILAPVAGGYAVNDGTAAQTVSYNIDVLNCVVLGTNQTGLGFLTLRPQRITAINTILRNLQIVVDLGVAGIGQAIFEQDNCLFNNFRNFRVGTPDFTDILADPQFTNLAGGDLTLLFTSPCRESGRDIRANGYGATIRQPPAQIDFTPNQQGISRGAFEFRRPATTAAINPTNLLSILAALADEDNLTAQFLALVRNNRFITDADAQALGQRWGAFFNAFPISSWDLPTWRAFLEELFRIFQGAPDEQAFFRLGNQILGLEPWLFSYFKLRRFPLDTDLKITAKRVGVNPTLTVTLHPGLFQLFRRRFRVQSTDEVLPDNSVTVIYADGRSLRDIGFNNSDYDAAIFQTADQTLLSGRKRQNLTGNLTFTPGSNQVTGVGTLFTTEINPETDKIRAQNTVYWYQVLSIQDNTHLTLRDNFEQTMQFREPSEVSKVVDVFGVITTAGGDVTAIQDVPGRLGLTSFADDIPTRYGAFQLISPVNRTGLAQGPQKEKLIDQLFGAAKEVAKLGFHRFQDQTYSVIL